MDDQSSIKMKLSKPITSPDLISNPQDDPKRHMHSIADMSALRNIYNISKNTAGTSENEGRDGGADTASNPINVQSLLKFCSGYSIEHQNLTHDHMLENQKSLTVEKDKELGDQSLKAENLSSSQ